MNVLVCGGRNYSDYRFLEGKLNALCELYSKEYNPHDNWLPSDIVIIHGGALGADTLAERFAIINYCRIKQFAADWYKYGKSAGPIRNKKMLEEGKPDIVLAFSGGKGTANMVKIAKEAGVPVLEF